MPVIAVNVRMPWITTEVRGAVSSNTWHFNFGADTPDPTNTLPIFTAVGTFYTTVLAPHLSSQFDGAIEISAVDTSLPKPRLPYDVGATTFTPGGDSLPGEVAVKVGLKSAKVLGVPSQRGRGTLQLGPLAQDAITSGGVLTTAFMDEIEAGLIAVRTAAAAVSRPLVVGSILHGFVPVTQVIMSNECGTVRRRQFPTTDRRVITW